MKPLHIAFIVAALLAATTAALADTLITTREGLAAIANDLGGFYVLGADIDLGGTDWTPIGTASEPFTGSLHGNGYAIRNLACTNSLSGSDYRGLFGCVSNATIEGFSVSGTVAGKQYVGGLVGCITGGTVISNCIATVEIAATNSYAGGLIGACAGGSAVNRIVDCRADGFVSGDGCVSGVHVEDGYVTGGPADSGLEDVGFGGLAGKIDSKSLVDGCWFVGEVWNTSSVNTGGFVGYTADAPVILRCCVESYVANESSKSYTGGFVGNHGGGFIADSSAQSSVDSSDGYGGNGGDNVGGFAGGVSKAARIATSWCYSYVSSEGGHYRGGFVGQASSGLVTGSYYEDTESNLKAVGTSSGSDDYDGITPLGDEEMQLKESFTALDFDDVWKIDEETYPYLRTLFSAYELWLNDVGITDEPKPEDMVNGIPAGVRYVFGIDPSIGPADLAEPLLDITFNANGKPVVKLPVLVNTEGATVTVLATEDLNDWSPTALVPMAIDLDDGTWKPVESLADPNYVYPPKMFFRWSVDIVTE